MFRNHTMRYEMISTIGMAAVESTTSTRVAVLTSDVVIELATCLYILLQSAHLVWKWRVDWSKRRLKKLKWEQANGKA